MSTVKQMRSKQPKWVNWVLAAGFIVSVIVILASCSTAQELMDKAEKKDPAIVAKLARDKYPCKDILKPDTAVVYKDSLVFVEVECPEVVTTETIIKTDTINNVVTKTIRVPVTIRTAGQVITKWYEDSAKLKIAAMLITLMRA